MRDAPSIAHAADSVTGGPVRPASPAPPAEGSGSPLPPELAAYAPLLSRLGLGLPAEEARSRLVERALDVWARPGFDVFVSTPRLRFEPFPYQLQAAATVLRRMRGRAILADEVGLGKTIEAGLVLTELRLRRLAEQVLVLVPVGLVDQWQEELDRKFALPSMVVRGRAESRVGLEGEVPILIASLQAARRPPLRDTLTAPIWDLVIVDEAHRLKNPRSVSAGLVRALRARHMLLLTATPVENRLSDLYHLVTLASPGLLGTPQEFRTRHAATHRAGPPRNLPELRSRLRDVMVRHRRSEVALMLPRRLAETRRVVLGEREAELYRLVSARVREHARGAAPSRRLALSTVQRLAGSSPAALGPTLVKLGWDDLAARADGTGRTEKGRVLLDLLGRHGARGEQVVVFTAFRRTLEHISGLLREGGLPAAVYHGSLSRPEKARAIEEFRAGAPVLLTTEPAGEGRNLQFCHVMVNFDLPWNPMQIEQRLGRIHRIGQDHDVVLTNLVGRGTVEDHMLRVLEAKINLFELVVGELDMILGRVEDEFDFESFVFSAYVQSEDDGEFRSRLESLGDDLARARASYSASREQLDVLVGEPGEEPNRESAGERVG